MDSVLPAVTSTAFAPAVQAALPESTGIWAVAALETEGGNGQPRALR